MGAGGVMGEMKSSIRSARREIAQREAELALVADEKVKADVWHDKRREQDAIVAAEEAKYAAEIEKATALRLQLEAEVAEATRVAEAKLEAAIITAGELRAEAAKVTARSEALDQERRGHMTTKRNELNEVLSEATETAAAARAARNRFSDAISCAMGTRKTATIWMRKAGVGG